MNNAGFNSVIRDLSSCYDLLKDSYSELSTLKGKLSDKLLEIDLLKTEILYLRLKNK